MRRRRIKLAIDPAGGCRDLAAALYGISPPDNGGSVLSVNSVTPPGEGRVSIARINSLAFRSARDHAAKRRRPQALVYVKGRWDPIAGLVETGDGGSDIAKMVPTRVTVRKKVENNSLFP